MWASLVCFAASKTAPEDRIGMGAVQILSSKNCENLCAYLFCVLFSFNVLHVHRCTCFLPQHVWHLLAVYASLQGYINGIE